MLIRRAVEMLLLAALLSGCVGPDQEMNEQEGWIKHTASPAELKLRRQREEMVQAEVETRYANQRMELTSMREKHENKLLDGESLMPRGGGGAMPGGGGSMGSGFSGGQGGMMGGGESQRGGGGGRRRGG